MARVSQFWGRGDGQVTQNSNTTTYYMLAAGVPNGNATEANAEVSYYVAGSLEQIYIRVTAYTLSGGTPECQVVSRKNRGSGNLAIAFTGTGEYSDDDNPDSFSANDELDFRVATTGTSGNVQWSMIGSAIEASSNTVIKYRRTASQTLNRNTTYYIPICGESSAQTTESYCQTNMGGAGTLKNLWVNVGSYTISGTSTATSRINGVDGNLSVSFSGTGVYDDLYSEASHSDSVAAGDLVNIELVLATGSGSQSAQVAPTGIDWETTDKGYALVYNVSSGQGNNITCYYSASGHGGATTTESRVQYPMTHAADAVEFWVNVTASGANSVLKVRKNAADTAMSIALNSGTGEFTDTDVVSFTIGDYVNFGRTGSNSTTIRGMALYLEDTTVGLSGKITAVDAEITYSTIKGKITAVDSEVTYSTVLGKITAADAEITYNVPGAKVTAADAEVTYDTVKGKVTAADAEVTYDTITGKITAADAEITYSTVLGKITAADLDVTYDPIKARIVAADSEITYSMVLGKITAADLDITYTPVMGKVTAVDAEITYSVTGVPTGRITAADAEVTYSTVSGKITAVDAEATYDTVKGKVTAADAEITYTPRGSKITAADIEIIYTPVAGKVTAADAEITYDPVVAKITATDAEITYDAVKGKIVAADAEITYTIAGQAARITATDLVITFLETQYQQLWPKIRNRGDLIPHREPRLLGSPRRRET